MFPLLFGSCLLLFVVLLCVLWCCDVWFVLLCSVCLLCLFDWYVLCAGKYDLLCVFGLWFGVVHFAGVFN